MSHGDHHHDLASFREQIKGTEGREFWRSLEELAQTEAFQEYLHREFPPDAAYWDDPTGRRNFLKLMSASLAFAGLAGCTVQPKQELVPYVENPAGLIPGKAQFYATAITLGGAAEGLLVEAHEGRPTKIEGNPDHPASLGSATALAQASILSMYDPDRSQTVTYVGDTRAWGDFLNEARAAMDAQRGKGGSGLRILSESITSPTLTAQLEQLLTELPQAKVIQYDAAGGDGARAGAKLAFGQIVNTYYKLQDAEVIVSLDSDFLTSGPGSIRYARDFVNRRRFANGNSEMSRFYAAESSLTPTGAKADHRIATRASDIETLAVMLAAKLGVAGAPQPGSISDAHEKWVTAAANDLRNHRGKCAVIPGQFQSASVHAIAHAINHSLGNSGATVIHTDPIDMKPVEQGPALRELVGEMNAGKVEFLVILGGNPVYNAPGELNFIEALKKVPLRVHMSMFNDETSEYCQWHVPETHFLEGWSDSRAYDGTISIVQPLVQPLYNGRTYHELLAVMLNKAGQGSMDAIKDYWKSRPGGNSDDAWKKTLHDGVVADSALPHKELTPGGGWASAIKPRPGATDLEVVVRPDPNIYDGRFVNNGWLQELPKPITKVTWDNIALISTEMATKRLNLAPEGKAHEAQGKVIELDVQGRKVSVPVWVQPGHAENSITVFLGYGRSRAGHIGSGIGYNAYPLRGVDSPWIITGAKATQTGDYHELASTQEHFAILGFEDRQIVRVGELENFKKDPKSVFGHEKHEPPKELSLYPHYDYPGYKWGMAIDLNACVGCNACVVACQAENNIAVVGKEMVRRNREMHWLRIDTYFKGSVNDPQTIFQPMMCQHCEQAPCEVVCPVNATVHDAEGLNVQVYNRCVGTRYCANNCPYKVRRFNYLLYTDYETPSFKYQRNPDVTVRSRGVMEKCTYCVQRIMRAKIESEKENRKVRDGEIVTACQQTCPTEALIFGNLNDAESRVAKLQNDPRNYGAIAEIGTRPRTRYLAAVRNPSSELEATPASHGSQHG